MDSTKTTNEILLLEKKIIDSDTSAYELGQIFSAEFLEFGSSGKTYDKDGVIKALSGMPKSKTEISDFKINFLTDDVVLATYTASKTVNDNKSFSLRSSIWMFKDERWQIHFHQGTMCK